MQSFPLRHVTPSLLQPHSLPAALYSLWSLNDISVKETWHITNIQRGFPSFPLKMKILLILMKTILWFRYMHLKTFSESQFAFAYLYCNISFLNFLYDALSLILVPDYTSLKKEATVSSDTNVVILIKRSITLHMRINKNSHSIAVNHAIILLIFNKQRMRISFRLMASLTYIYR